MNPYANKAFGFLLHKAGFGFFSQLARALKPLDIAPELWTILNQLHERDGITQTELAKRMSKDQTNLGRNLDKLEAKGYIRRSRLPSDRRAYLLHITEAGQKLRLSAVPRALELQETLLTGLSDEDRQALRRCLLTIIDNAERLQDGEPYGACRPDDGTPHSED